MSRITASINRNPTSVSEARRQWAASLAAEVLAERVYNAAIEKGLPEHEAPDDTGSRGNENVDHDHVWEWSLKTEGVKYCRVEDCTAKRLAFDYE